MIQFTTIKTLTPTNRQNEQGLLVFYAYAMAVSLSGILTSYTNTHTLPMLEMKYKIITVASLKLPLLLPVEYASSHFDKLSNI